MYVCAAIPLWNSLHQFSALGNHSLTTHLHTGWWAPLRTRSHDHASHMTLFVRSLGLDAIKVCVCVLIDWYSSLHYKSFFNKSVALQLICICKFRFLMQICFFRYWVLLFPPFHFHTLYLFTVIFTFFHHMDSTKKKGRYFPNITFVITTSTPHPQSKLIYSHADASTYLRLLFATQKMKLCTL